jgi:hypothetical protein
MGKLLIGLIIVVAVVIIYKLIQPRREKFNYAAVKRNYTATTTGRFDRPAQQLLAVTKSPVEKVRIITTHRAEEIRDQQGDNAANIFINRTIEQHRPDIVRMVADDNLELTEEEIHWLFEIHDAQIENAIARAGGADAMVGRVVGVGGVGGGAVDPQNVHDSVVVKSLNHILDRLKTLTGVIEPEYVTSVIASVRRHMGENTSAERTLKLVETYVSIVTPYGESPSVILARVWKRSGAEVNKSKLGREERGELIKGAVVEALADASAGGVVVCGSGIIARLLDSLNKRDIDPQLGNIVDLASVKDEIMGEVAKIYQRRDEEREKIEIADRTTDEEFNRSVIDEMGRHIDTYSEILNDADIALLKKQSIEAVL